MVHRNLQGPNNIAYDDTFASGYRHLLVVHSFLGVTRVDAVSLALLVVAVVGRVVGPIEHD